MRKLSCGKDLQSRTSQPGSDTCKYESHRNVRVLILIAFPFLVHVVQSVLHWGKDPILVVKREEGSKKNQATRITNKEITLRCKRRQTA